MPRGPVHDRNLAAHIKTWPTLCGTNGSGQALPRSVEMNVLDQWIAWCLIILSHFSQVMIPSKKSKVANTIMDGIPRANLSLVWLCQSLLSGECHLPKNHQTWNIRGPPRVALAILLVGVVVIGGTGCLCPAMHIPWQDDLAPWLPNGDVGPHTMAPNLVMSEIQVSMWPLGYCMVSAMALRSRCHLLPTSRLLIQVTLIPLCQWTWYPWYSRELPWYLLSRQWNSLTLVYTGNPVLDMIQHCFGLTSQVGLFYSQQSSTRQQPSANQDRQPSHGTNLQCILLPVRVPGAGHCSLIAPSLHMRGTGTGPQISIPCT